MITVGKLLEQIGNDINETSVKHKSIIIGAITAAYKFVLGEHPFSCASASYSPSSALTASAAQPLILPSDLDDITSVEDYNSTATDYDIYYEDFTKGRNPKCYRNWYYDTPVQSALDSGSGVSVDNGSTTVTLGSGAFDADAAGEYIVIGQDPNVYEISTRDSDTELTLATAFRGVDQMGVAYVIRPPFITKRIKFVDANSNLLSPTALKIWYQRIMPDLTQETDIVPIPNEGAPVYYKALQMSMRRKGWATAAAKLEPDYKRALALAKKKEPASKSDIQPKAMFRRPRDTSTFTNMLLRN